MIVLDVRDLKSRNTAPRAWLMPREKAASVLLWRFHTAPPTAGTWDNYDHDDPFPIDQLKVQVYWDEPAREVLQALGNDWKNIEYAAEGVAIAIANHLGFSVLGDSSHGSGTDLLMVPRGEPENDYYKMEVSGMASVGDESPKSRLRKKVAQALKGQFDRPGMALVVRFADLCILSEGWR